jgi:hypothetical protein
MGNVATSEVRAAVDRAAAQLLDAAGADGIVSRKDIRTKLLSLEGKERELVDSLYRFIDRRDDKRSARMTRRDIDDALAYIREELVDRFDLDNNGLSEDEVARMSELGKLAVSLARTLKDVTGNTDESLARQLKSLTASGIYFDNCFGTEGGVDIQFFQAEAKLSQVSADTFRSTLGLKSGPEEEIVRFEPAEQALQAIARTYWDDPDLEEDDKRTAAQARKLVELMKTQLRDTHAVILGRNDPELVGSNHPLYIVGLDSSGSLLGLKTYVVWT